MKKLLLLLPLLCLGMSPADANRIADAIKRLEGPRHPYGILSVKTKHSRQVCLNTIRHNYARWIKAGRTNDFLDFLADRYCSQSSDKIGNQRWKKNIHILLTTDKGVIR